MSPTEIDAVLLGIVAVVAGAVLVAAWDWWRSQ